MKTNKKYKLTCVNTFNTLTDSQINILNAICITEYFCEFDDNTLDDLIGCINDSDNFEDLSTTSEVLDQYYNDLPSSILLSMSYLAIQIDNYISNLNK